MAREPEARNRHLDQLEILRVAYNSGASHTAYIPYAEALRGAKNFTTALAVCVDGLQYDTHSVRGRTLLGKIYYDMGRYDEALAELELALKAAPQAYQTKVMLAKTLVRKRQFERARKIVDLLKAMTPEEMEIQQLDQEIREQYSEVKTEYDAVVETSREQVYWRMPFDDLAKQIRAFLDELPGVKEYFLNEMNAHVPTTLRAHAQTSEVVEWFLCSLMHHTKNLRIGELEKGFLQLTAGYLIFYVIESYLLAIVTDATVRIGQLRHWIDQLLENEGWANTPH
jgi:tetratricopeptide (TPR) repeat protein